VTADPDDGLPHSALLHVLDDALDHARGVVQTDLVLIGGDIMP
jgi:hypothetical protein